VILYDYHSQFKEGLWRVFAWCIHTLSIGLQYVKSPNYDTFNAFVFNHFATIEKIVLQNDAVELADKNLVR
jgi:hypothetical protein